MFIQSADRNSAARALKKKVSHQRGKQTCRSLIETLCLESKADAEKDVDWFENQTKPRMVERAALADGEKPSQRTTDCRTNERLTIGRSGNNGQWQIWKQRSTRVEAMQGRVKEQFD